MGLWGAFYKLDQRSALQEKCTKNNLKFEDVVIKTTKRREKME